jgi:hypothetical protein
VNVQLRIVKEKITMKKQSEIVSLSETYVAGLAFRTKNELEQNPATGWIAKTWGRVRTMKNPNPRRRCRRITKATIIHN